MKLYKILYEVDAYRMIKYVFANEIEEAKNFIKEKYFECWCYVYFIEIKEIEIKKGIID